MGACGAVVLKSGIFSVKRAFIQLIKISMKTTFLGKIASVLASASMLLMALAPFTAQAAGGYSIQLTNQVVTGPYSIALTGTASANPYIGNLNAQHVAVTSWGDASSTIPTTFTITNSTTNPKTFTGNWSASHKYAAAGTYTVTIAVYHSQPTGQDGTDISTIAVQAVIPPATLTVIKNVVNTGGGSLSASDFALHVTGTGVGTPSPASFSGSNTGTVVSLFPGISGGTFSVTEDIVASYVQTSAVGCAGSVSSGNSLTCTITNTYTPKLAQTITFAPLGDKTYGDIDFTVSATASSGLPVTFTSQTPSVCTVSGSTVSMVSAGTCTIRASQAGDATYNAAPNVDQSFTVAPKSLTASLTGVVTKVYDATTEAILAASNYILTGVVGTDSVTLNNPTIGMYDTKDVGTGKTVSVSGLAISGAQSSNYSLTNTTASANIGEITARAITVTADSDQSKIFGTPDLAFSYHVTSGSLGSGDSFTGALSRATGEDVGTYAILKDTLSAGANYDLTYVGANFAITPAEAVVTIGDQNADYDGTPKSVSVTTNPEGLTCTVTYTGSGETTYGPSTTPPTSAGSYSVTADCTDGNSTGPASGTLTIHKVDATIVVTPYSVTYNGSSHTASATATGVGSVDLSGSLDLSGTTHTSAGTYATDAWTFAGGTNYNDASGTVGDTIAKADAEISVTPYLVTFDGNPHTATGSVAGVGEDGSLSGLDLSGTTHTDVGTYAGDPWTFTDTTGNYNDASGTVDDAISAEPVVTPPTPTPPSGGSGGGGGGGGCAAGFTWNPSTLKCVPNGQVLGTSTTTGQVLGVSCGLYMDQHLKKGSAKNKPGQVTRLQQFLNKYNFGKFTPTGYFGPLTEAAVKAFQKQYSNEILKPWNLTSPTGLAYLTTLRQLNNIECPDLMLPLPTLVPWNANPNAQ